MRHFEKPKKMDPVLPVTPITTQAEWEKQIQSSFARYKKFMNRGEAKKKGDGLSAFDYTDKMSKRRQRAILNSISEIYKRYKSPETNQPCIGQMWIDLNMPFLTYSNMDVQSHVLFAASIWILDQITATEGWRDIYRLLPTDDEILDELCCHDAWDAGYDYELIYSVEYVLHHRNPIEIDGARYHRTITSEYLAGGATGGGEKDRQNYDALIAMIPQDAIEKAVSQFRSYFWRWVDRFYENAAPFIEETVKKDHEVRESREKFNKVVDEFSAMLDKMEGLRKQKPKINPLVMAKNPLELLKSQDTASFVSGSPFSSSFPTTEAEKALDDVLVMGMRLDRAAARADNMIDEANKAYSDLRSYGMSMCKRGRLTSDGLADYEGLDLAPMEPMQIDDPYAMCFALLYLAEADDDLPWLYGATCGFMSEVIETLPWGIFEYDELDDDVWENNERPELPESVTIPNIYRRSYRMEEDDFDFPRNFAQIIYEETGCILPRDLHIYDSKAEILKNYGLDGKDAANALVLMSTLGTIRREVKALNFDQDIDLFGDEPAPAEEEKPTPTEDVTALKEEIKKLKSALHAADKENRETRKTLSTLRATAERDHRELADLREYVFNQQEEPEEEAPVDESKWPYEVQKDTLVFGGHATWAKGIRGLLNGNIRFIDKDLVFDTGLIRHAQVIWIQPNALAHKMYYRIVDTARQYGKPVRYFTYASWMKCAEQVVEGDRLRLTH